MRAHSLPAAAGRSARVAAAGAERVAAALCILLGALLMQLGTTWDVHWHIRVGRDAFWIPPHVVLYAGLGVIAAALAALVARETAAPRPGARSLLGLRASGGTWISSAGVGAMLAGAVFDDWWHRTFGLDVTLWSPPHLVLIGGAAVILLGALATLSAALRDGTLSPRASRWARFGLIVGFGQFFGPFGLAIQPALPLSLVAVERSRDPFLYPLLAALAMPFVLTAARTATGRRFGAFTTVAIVIGLTILANRLAALGFALMGLPPLALGRWVTALRWLPLAPALALDLVAGSPGRGRLRLGLGAAAWSVVLLGELVLVWRRTGGPAWSQALSMLPPVAAAAVIAALAGHGLGRRLRELQTPEG